MTESITIFCVNTQSKHTISIGSSLLEIQQQIGYRSTYPVVCGRVNNKTEDLNYRIYQSKDIDLVDMSQPTGMRVYVRSLCFLLYKAINELFPEGELRIEHPISKGYFCKFNIGQEMTPTILTQIKIRMRQLIEQNLPFVRVNAPLHEAISLFQERKMQDKVSLLNTYTKPYISYHKLGDVVDYYYGALLPSTGYINLFELIPYKYGAILQVPNRKSPDRIESFVQQPKLFAAFEEHSRFNEILGVDTVGKLNLCIKGGHIPDLLKLSEVLHEKQIGKIADEIASCPDTKVILISGPSSSGKTTFSKRLSVQLMANLKRPIAISLDNYFVNRAQTPIDENGKPDYESLYALDLKSFNNDLVALLKGEEVSLPTYNFESGTRNYKGNKIRLGKNDLLLLEGIHALNPELTPHIDEKFKYRIYVSALTNISLDDHNWIPTADNRLLRRIIRDSKYRSHSAQQTIAMWDSVRRGEEKWIFPYQENADALFNSALLFELSVLKRNAEPLLLEVPQTCSEFGEAHRLLKFLNYFSSIYEREIPPTSLLREFLGGSSFRY